MVMAGMVVGLVIVVVLRENNPIKYVHISRITSLL
jgi:hypothetical protein